MTKTLVKIFSAFVVAIFLVSLASAITYYDYSYGTVRQTSTAETTTTSVMHYPFGTERKTVTVKESSSRNNFAPNYYHPVNPINTYSSNFYPAPATNFRYRTGYQPSQINYVNAYTTPYYYNAQYDSNLGYYNWRY